MNRHRHATMTAALLALGLAALAAPWGCAKFDAGQEPSAARSSPAPATAVVERKLGLTEKSDATGKNRATATPRKVIRNGKVRLVVKAYTPAREAIDAMVKRSGGYVSSSDVRHSLGEVSSATLVLRVPASSFHSIFKAITRLGVVQSESTSSEDITEAYYDLQARLKNARMLEARLLELLQTKTNKVTELLQVEKELARVRGKVERFEGKLRLYDNLVGLSTLTVNLDISARYVPPRPPSLVDDVKGVFINSAQSLADAGRGLLLLAVALLPWLIPLALGLWVLIRLGRWFKRKRQG